MAKIKTIEVQKITISVVDYQDDDYICITDMAKAKEGDSRAADIIKNWIRNRTTLEFLGTWEQMYNPNFKVVEFDHFKMQAGLPSFVLSPKQWRDVNPEYAKKGLNIRDFASINELAVLSNIESLNADMISNKIDKTERFNRLKQISEYQLEILNEKDFMKALRKLSDDTYVSKQKRLDK